MFLNIKNRFPYRSLTVLIIASIIAFNFFFLSHSQEKRKDTSSLQTLLLNNEHEPIGTITLTPATKGVLLKIEARKLPPGWHAVHIHQKADCSDKAFKASGSHVKRKDQKKHGLKNPEGPENADLPNLYVYTDGHLNAELYSERLSLGFLSKNKSNLLDQDGSALILHANADDHTSQPIGGAGPRIACSAILLHK